MTKTQKRRVVMKARHYTKIGEDLMVFGKDGVLRRVPFKEEIGLILRLCHDESGHQGKDQAVFLILRASFWWPSLVRDVCYWCKTCHLCQVNGERSCYESHKKVSLHMMHLRNGESMLLVPFQGLQVLRNT